MSHRVIHFEIHAEHPERAMAFSAGSFGWLAGARDTEGNIFGMMQDDAG